MTTTTTALGPIEIEVIRNALTAAAAEMDVTIWRTSRSTIVRELLDYSTAVFDAQGNNVAKTLNQFASQLDQLDQSNRETMNADVSQVNSLSKQIADLNREIARAYDVLLPAGVALRGLFLIDQSGVVRHQVVNDLSLGRSVDEALRMVKALQFCEKNGEVCPANWKEGARTIKANPTDSKKFFAAEYACKS